MTAVSGTPALAPYAHLAAFVDRLGAQAPMQRRTFDGHLAQATPEFLRDAEAFFADLATLLRSTGRALDDAVSSYVAICKDMVAEQFKFVRTGRYSAATFDQAQEKIADHEAMTRYMLGLAVTQYLWPQHYETFGFFRAFLGDVRRDSRYLDIGPGHGLYLVEALRNLPGASFAAVDISQASIDIARSFVGTLVRGSVRFDVQDIFAWAPPHRFDAIVMGEVLEHVEEPAKLLRRAASFLAPGGQLFVTTCANCPAIDHIYLFTCADEIRALIAAAGCSIVREHVAERDVGMRRKDGTPIVTTQYAAVVRAGGAS